jgi:hypothetical protein
MASAWRCGWKSEAAAMPQLVKGGKWVYGWVVVGPRMEVAIPTDAFERYGFLPGEEAVFLPGSGTSGGFGLTTPRLLAEASGGLESRILARGQIGEDRRVVVPPDVGIGAGERLLAVRGSGRALGFVARGPIFDEALKYPELEQCCACRCAAVLPMTAEMRPRS